MGAGSLSGFNSVVLHRCILHLAEIGTETCPTAPNWRSNTGGPSHGSTVISSLKTLLPTAPD